jgi:methylenetetrahydrofolate dehydrogenase (NADP+)/methenyltetrahydrofolate cyclohydrolase
VIITAVNTAGVLSASMIRPATVVVDAGVAEEEGELVGNVDPEVYNRDDIVITPQKGGVGPLTVCALFENVIRAAQNASQD